MRYLLAIGLLFCCACNKLRPDPIPISAAQANYPTAEIHHGGTIYNGSLMASQVKGSTFSFQVQGYYQGNIHVVSTACNYDKSVNYTDSNLLTFSVKLNQDCLFAITISPTYPQQANQAIIVYPITGFVAAKAITKGQAWVGTVRKITNYSAKNIWTVKTGDTQPVEVFLNGCGHYDQKITPVKGSLNMDLSGAYAGWGTDICVLDGVAISPVFQNLLLNVLATQYSPNFKPLPIPQIQVIDQAFPSTILNVWADPAVSLIALDTDYKFEYQTSFWFDPSKPHILRLLTVKGRTAFGTYSPNKRSWTWAH